MPSILCVTRIAVISVCLGVVAAPIFAENRTYDGLDNHPLDPTRGATFMPEIRLADAAYSDGMNAPAGADRPNPRMISNMVAAQTEMTPNARGFSDWVWQWGQFLDHDITLTEFGLEAFGALEEPLPIAVPMGDPMFDPDATGRMMIGMFRSMFDAGTGDSPDKPREQINQLTAFIDASNVYGSDEFRAAWLRTGEGGRMKTSAGDMLPFNDGSQVNAGPGGMPSFADTLFTAGDIRANEQSGLTAVHTLFVREHNRLADEIAAEHPDFSDEAVYQRARKIVGAQMQVVTYFEFLPALLGSAAPDALAARYDMGVDPTIANEFANACFRIGHTMLSPQIMRFNDELEEIDAGPLALRDAFFDLSRVMDEGGIEPILMGLAMQPMQEIDSQVIDDVRNFLFGAPGQGGFDLVSLNIQRGRDHGLADYNTVREAVGLSRVKTFADITSDPVRQARLEMAYGDVDKIDLWVGALAEDHADGAMVGELALTVLADQFTRLRDGDRFWYANDDEFTTEEIAELEATRLSDIISRNTGMSNVPADVFKVTTPDPVGNGGGRPLVSLCGSLGMIHVAMMATFLPMMRRRRNA
jgi:hypothetical protein